MSVDTLVQVMQAQTVVMNELAGLEKAMLKALLDKDAAAAQACLERNNQLAGHLNQAEEVRVALIGRIAAQLGIVSHPGSSTAAIELYERILLRLDGDDRARLQDAGRAFRMAIRGMINMNQALRMYTEAQLATLDGFMAELIPNRSDGVYGADGRQAASARPLLLNRQA